MVINIIFKPERFITQIDSVYGVGLSFQRDQILSETSEVSEHLKGDFW